MPSFKNYAGDFHADEAIATELALAGITVQKLELLRNSHPEMRTSVLGQLGPWRFRRAWRYWIATGPGIPPAEAERLHTSHGQAVRVDGHCGCPSPLEWFQGFAVGCYHVDTQDGLNALAATIRSILENADAQQQQA